MGSENSTSSYIPLTPIIGEKVGDDAYIFKSKDIKNLNDQLYYIVKMLQGGLNLANLNKDTNQTFADTNGNVAEIALTAMGLETSVSNINGDISTLEQTASGLTTTVSNLNGDVSNLDYQVSIVSQTVDGLSIADETGSYTIINGDKLVSKDHDTGAATVIEDGEIKVYSDLENFIWDGSMGYAYPGVFIIKNMRSDVPLKIEGIGNMSIDASGKIYICTSSTASGNVDIGKTGGTINLNGTVLNNGNALGTAVFT